jgi:Flp pilus assembly protein TadD
MSFVVRQSNRLAYAPLCLLLGLLSGCGTITVRDAPNTATRTLPEPAPKQNKQPQSNAATGLKLARMLRDQGSYESASSIYAQLERRGELQPLELLEYATVAAQVQTPQDSLALFGRARHALRGSDSKLAAGTTVALCNGLGRARMALGQNEAALTDFDCSLAAQPDDLTALNAKGVLLDSRGEHAQARELFNRALQIAPADFRVLNNLALSWLASGDSAQAIRLLSQSQVPEWPTLRLNLAFAQALAGDEEQARKTLGALLSPALAQHALDDFARRRERIRGGEPLAQELLEASRTLLPLREDAGHG